MKIVNPIYDNAFKYLMENEEIAKIVLSIILETKVLRFQSKPQETTLIFTEGMHVSRFDFKAVILNEQQEEKLVLIELQKYKHPDPVYRFRKYLGQNYIKNENIINNKGQEKEVFLPIIAIYILGFDLPEFESQAVKIENRPYDLINQEYIKVKSKFASLLTHQSYILQAIPKKTQKNTRIEKFLSFFLQKVAQEESNTVIEIDPQKIIQDQELNQITTYLNKAVLDENLRRKLDYEEQYEKSINILEADLAEERRQKEEERRQKEEERRQKEEERRQKEEAQKNLLAIAKELLKSGMNIEKVHEITKFNIEELKKL